MSDPTTQPTAAAPTVVQPGADNTESHVASLDERTDALFERYAAESREEQGIADAAEPTEPAPTAETPTDAPAVEAPPAKPRESDKDLELRAKAERERVAWKREQVAKEREAKEREATYAKREASLAALEKRFEDPTEFLSWIEEKGWGDKYAQHIIDLTANPAKRAEIAAKRIAQETAAKQDERIAAIEAREKELRETETRVRAERSLTSRIEQVTEHAPHVARFLKKSPERAIAHAHAVAATLSSQGLDFNLDDVIINMQRELSEYASTLTETPARVAPTETVADPAKPSPHSAPATATTVSNRAAASRTGIVTEDAPLSYRDRIAAAERRARQQR